MFFFRGIGEFNLKWGINAFTSYVTFILDFCVTFSDAMGCQDGTQVGLVPDKCTIHCAISTTSNVVYIGSSFTTYVSWNKNLNLSKFLVLECWKSIKHLEQRRSSHIKRF